MSADLDLVPEPEHEITTGNLPAEGADPLVDHPFYYNMHPAGIECIDVVEEMTNNLGTAMKYMWRHGLKVGGDEWEKDLKKAIWYIEREIDRLNRRASDSGAPLTGGATD